MPQLTHHDFYSNFTASIKSGDLDLTNDILANEISDFIVFDTDKIIKALNSSDIKIDNTCTDEQIVDLVIKNISENKKLSKALAYIIAEGNDLFIKVKDENNQLKIVSTISNGIKTIGSEITKKPESFKTSTMDQVVSKAGQRAEYKRIIWNKDRGGMNAGWVILIGGGIIALAIVAIYYRQKNSVSNSIPNMIAGGPIDGVINSQALPVAQPTPNIAAPVELKPEPLPITQ